MTGPGHPEGDATATPPHFNYYDEGSLSAATYDVLENAAQPYKSDADLILARSAGITGPVLELGSGTGRLAWQLARAGHQVVGLELSKAMLVQAEAKGRLEAPEVAPRCRFVLGDMAAFSLNAKFDRIISPFRTFNYLLTQERQLGCMASMRAHLAPHGEAIINFRMVDRPEYMASQAALEQHKYMTVRIRGTDKLVQWEILSRRIDLLEQLFEQQVKFTYRVVDGPVLRSDVETFRISWLTRREARHLIARAGFRIIAEYDDFKEAAPMSDYTVVFAHA
jgi:SAM-dependent methyltransferase